MKAKTVAAGAVGLLVWGVLLLSAIGQEGHPMTGSWVGYWQLDGGARNRVVVIIDWTGRELACTINPGPNAIPVRVARVDPSDWSLHMEADTTMGGRPVTYVIDGKVDDLLAYNRTIAGTWRAGDAPGNFSITRQ